MAENPPIKLPLHPLDRQRQLFLGKYCTVLIPMSGFPMTAQDAAITFVGRVVDISEMGVLIEYPNGNHALFYWDKIMGIVENEVVSEEPSTDTVSKATPIQETPETHSSQSVGNDNMAAESGQIIRPESCS